MYLLISLLLLQSIMIIMSYKRVAGEFWIKKRHLTLLFHGTVLKTLCKTVKSDYKLHHACLSIRPSVMEQLGSHCKDFHEILYVRIFQKSVSVKKIQVSLKSDKNNRYFTWKPM